MVRPDCRYLTALNIINWAPTPINTIQQAMDRQYVHGYKPLTICYTPCDNKTCTNVFWEQKGYMVAKGKHLRGEGLVVDRISGWILA